MAIGFGGPTLAAGTTTTYTIPNNTALNVYTSGAVVTNATIVLAGTNGAINTYVTYVTDLVIGLDRRAFRYQRLFRSVRREAAIDPTHIKNLCRNGYLPEGRKLAIAQISG